MVTIAIILGWYVFGAVIFSLAYGALVHKYRRRRRRMNKPWWGRGL